MDVTVSELHDFQGRNYKENIVTIMFEQLYSVACKYNALTNNRYSSEYAKEREKEKCRGER